MNKLPYLAVVGAGYWGKNLVRVFHELGALDTVCDSSEQVLKTLESRHPGIRGCRRLQEVLERPEIRAVAIATPAVTHFQIALQALEAGKDVFVEKPLSLVAHDAKRLIARAQELGRVLMVGHILQYHPAVLRLRELIHCGELGQIRYVYSNRLNIGKIRTEENILWSFAPHDISVMLGLLGESPLRVSCQGGAYLNSQISDLTLSQFVFGSGVQGHIYVSWLHPFKEQRLVVVGSKKMAVFDDAAEQKLVLYPHSVEWINRQPTAVKAKAEVVPIETTEPLKAECQHFLECIESRSEPRTGGAEGLRVLEVLEACQRSLNTHGSPVDMQAQSTGSRPYFAHESAYVDEGASIGKDTKIWHFAHVMKGARLGERCVIGQNVNIDGGTVIGDNVKIQNNVSVYAGTIIEDDVFLGPSCVLTNVTNPRSQINRHNLYEKTVFRRGCTVGANATIVCGVTIGRYAFAGAGAVVTKDVPDYALVLGNPARQCGWMSRHGHRLNEPDAQGIMTCPEAGLRYRVVDGRLQCLDLDEESPLPEEMRVGRVSHGQLKGKEMSKTPVRT